MGKQAHESTVRMWVRDTEDRRAIDADMEKAVKGPYLDVVPLIQPAADRRPLGERLLLASEYSHQAKPAP